MRILAHQLLSTNSAPVIGITRGLPAEIRAIEIVKTDGTAATITVHLPLRSEAVGDKNRIFQASIGTAQVVREYDPPLTKDIDASMFATGNTNATIIVYGD